MWLPGLAHVPQRVHRGVHEHKASSPKRIFCPCARPGAVTGASEAGRACPTRPVKYAPPGATCRLAGLQQDRCQVATPACPTGPGPPRPQGARAYVRERSGLRWLTGGGCAHVHSHTHTLCTHTPPTCDPSTPKCSQLPASFMLEMVQHILAYIQVSGCSAADLPLAPDPSGYALCPTHA